jgi:hypothetical protein
LPLRFPSPVGNQPGRFSFQLAEVRVGRQLEQRQARLLGKRLRLPGDLPRMRDCRDTELRDLAQRRVLLQQSV